MSPKKGRSALSFRGIKKGETKGLWEGFRARPEESPSSEHLEESVYLVKRLK